MAEADLRIRVVSSIADVPAAAWDACAAEPHLARADASPGQTDAPARVAPPNPFVSHAFLLALEASKSATARTGWQPQHLIAESAEGAVAGVMPCYLKSHSRGEYVFDAGWADAYERAGGDYYPKLQVSVPFTPAAGPRLMVRPDVDRQRVSTALAAGAVELARLRQASSVHVTFLSKAEWELLGEHGFLRRIDQQFHWDNAGYATFEDFLGTLASRKRKAIRRERREAAESGIEIAWLTGADLTEGVWDAFFDFYIETGSRKWGTPYLTRAFFSLIGQSMRERILLVVAKRSGRLIAGAINFIGATHLYGRHWGAIEHHPFLHFELCYYQAIDYAIAHGLARVEAGAQGEHKLARGYLPVTTYSAHYIADPALRRAIADYLRRERRYVEAAGAELAALAPFRKDATADRD